MKKSLMMAGMFSVAALAGLAPAAQAEDNAWGPFTAGVNLTSDYRFRGISNSDRGAAVQGWVQYDHASGFYGNVWASSIDFNDSGSYDSSIEVDLTAGYNFNLGENTTIGGRAVYYWYADADTPAASPDYDYWEFIASAEHSYGKFAVSAELAYSPDFFAETGDAWALTGGVSADLLDSFLFFDGLSASGHVGKQWIDEGTDYLYYDIGFSAPLGPTTLDVRWVDTDLSKTECGTTDNCEGGIVVSLSADLP